jgi:hypothetical protein
MKFVFLIMSFLFQSSLDNHPKILDVKEFRIESSLPVQNVFTSNNFSISKSKYEGENFYILTSRRNDNQEIFQTLFLNSKSLEDLPKMDKGQELKVCIYFYKKELGYRGDINLSDKELSDEIIFIEGVRNQKYFYEYCGTNMFVKKTEDEKFFILINNTLQTPKNWFDNKENLIELTKESLNDLFELLSQT